jgi:hypothetical protein
MGRDGEGWGGGGQFQVTWDQGGRDSTTQKEGFQGSKGELARGVSKGLRLYLILLICIYIYIISMYECGY